MKADLREIYGAPTRAVAEAAIDVFADKYGAKYEKAVACLTKDREALLAFFDFPAEHWDHLRTSNPIESVFATVRHRTVRTKGALSAKTAKLMVFKLVNAAAKTWRRLKGENQLPKVVQGVNSKTASRSSKCRLTTPPNRSRHPISCIAPCRCRQAPAGRRRRGRSPPSLIARAWRAPRRTKLRPPRSSTGRGGSRSQG